MTRTTFFLGALLALPVGAVAADADRSTADSNTLQVKIEVPATVDPFHEDDLVQVFGDSLRVAFRQRGYEGQIEDVYWNNEPKSDLPLLRVNLIRWERNRTGGIECAFSASIRPVNGEERSLGVFRQTELGLSITNRWSLHEAFRDAAERAAQQMYRRIAELNVIPGISGENKR